MKTPEKWVDFVQKAHDKYPFSIYQLGKKMKFQVQPCRHLHEFCIPEKDMTPRYYPGKLHLRKFLCETELLFN